MKSTALRHRKRKNRRGATIVEFALVAPFLFIICFACMEFQRFHMMSAMAEDAAYFAARNVMVPGATVSEGEAVGLDNLAAIGTKGATVDVDPYAGTTLQTDIDEDTTTVTVTVTVPITQNALFIPLFLTSGNITKSVTLATERFNGYFDGNGVP